ncbi:unnamed protein product [Closterium sp. Yama58-4]|nr:unnamed protein product [Closterium sp. Yama58-4]
MATSRFASITSSIARDSSEGILVSSLAASRPSPTIRQSLLHLRAISRIAILVITSLLAVSLLSITSDASPLPDASAVPDAQPLPGAPHSQPTASFLPETSYSEPIPAENPPGSSTPIPEPLSSLQTQSVQNLSLPSSEVLSTAPDDGTAAALSKLIGADGTPGKVFNLGPYKPVERSSIGGPMFIFKHGWATRNFWFSGMLKRVVSHGYIVVAPQMYPLIGLTGAVYEMKGSCAVIRWLKDNLKNWLSRHPILHRRTKASPDWSKFALTGHSRGGKVAFGVLRKLFCKSVVPIKAQFLIDPVNGGGERSSRKSGDSVLTYVPNSIQFSGPVAVLGAGRGGSCAPEGDNYKEFYSDLVGPAWKFVVPEYGHADFFNNWLGPGITFISKHFCKNGPARKPMRVVTAGLMVAFFQAKLLDDSADLDDLMANPGHSPALSCLSPSSPPSLQFAPPKPLRLWVPVSSSQLSAPLLVFQHGFAAKTHFYSQLLSRIASHGFIVVAPQMYPFIGRSNTRPEMRGSVRVITWVRANLDTWLQQKKQKRPFVGAKVAFGVTRNIVSPSSPVPITALLLFDPSDGTSNTSKNVPPVLVHRPNSLVVSAPVLIVGSGLGPIPKGPGLPACPPKYFGHKTFFSDLAGPAYYFVVPQYGHLDFYD